MRTANSTAPTRAMCHHFGGFSEKHAPVSIPQTKPTRYPPVSQLWLSAMRSNSTHGNRNSKPKAPLTTPEIGIFGPISSKYELNSTGLTTLRGPACTQLQNRQNPLLGWHRRPEPHKIGTRQNLKSARLRLPGQLSPDSLKGLQLQLLQPPTPQRF